MNDMIVEIIVTGPGDQVALFVDLGEEACFLGFCPNQMEGKRLAKHFARCCAVAYKEGFVLYPGFFVTEDDQYGVSVMAALDLNRSPKAFREVLRNMRKGVFTKGIVAPKKWEGVRRD